MNSGFSVVEISITILIVGLIIAGITNSNFLYTKYRVNLARSTTESSSVNSINNLVAWYETTLETSFDEKEAQGYDDLTSAERTLGKGSISSWYDNSSSGPSKINATQSTDDYKPHYQTNCIHHLPCLEFDGSDDYLAIPSNLDLSNKEYSIFIIEKKDSSGTEPYLFLGSNASTSGDDAINIGYETDSKILFSHGSTTNYYTITDDAVDSNDKIIMHSFIGGFKNSLLTTKVSHRMFDNTALSNLTDNGTPSFSYFSTDGETLRIGSGYNGSTETFYKGKIGEIIIFDRALKSDERKSIEEYLMKKWKLVNSSTPT